MKNSSQHKLVAIIDFGSQYTQLIARRIRELDVYCEIFTPLIGASELKKASAVILSGGPASVYDKNSPRISRALFSRNVPILGICYGLQMLCQHFGGKVVGNTKQREYGRADADLVRKDAFFDGVPKRSVVWMSHGDASFFSSASFLALAKTSSCDFAAVRHKDLPIYAVQFHPEVSHTEHGKKLLSNFLFKVAGLKPTWKMGSYIDEAVSYIKGITKGEQVLCAVSGGVDSAVVAALVHRAIGKNLLCIFVDNGLLRLGERDQIPEAFKRVGLEIKVVDEKDRFLSALKGVTDPERKRKIIGREFIRVFEDYGKGIKYLAQGTLYPDVIESTSPKGAPSAKIKTHHNVGGLPSRFKFKLIEPLRFLFKDEVRRMSVELGLPDEITKRQPFPGPGLAVRVLGPITWDRLELLRKADAIVQDEIQRSGYAKDLWQYFAVLLPVSSVGVMGDSRTYENIAAVRAVKSLDGMTADWARLPQDLLGQISTRIVNQVRGINRVVYDISNKPPSTIEWE